MVFSDLVLSIDVFFKTRERKNSKEKKKLREKMKIHIKKCEYRKTRTETFPALIIKTFVAVPEYNLLRCLLLRSFVLNNLGILWKS